MRSLLGSLHQWSICTLMILWTVPYLLRNINPTYAHMRHEEEGG